MLSSREFISASRSFVHQTTSPHQAGFFMPKHKQLPPGGLFCLSFQPGRGHILHPSSSSHDMPKSVGTFFPTRPAHARWVFSFMEPAMSRCTALISKARRRAHPAFSGPAKTLEQRETKRRLKAEDEGSLYLPSKAWLLEQPDHLSHCPAIMGVCCLREH